VENEEIVGFICGHDLGFRAYLSELVVANTHRDQGIGKRLVAHLESELASRGCAVLISDVWKDARGFYESMGWSPPDVILLRKKLGEWDQA
jgi:ribosomal protein S18 acetylase RimI-like enzyme